MFLCPKSGEVITNSTVRPCPTVFADGTDRSFTVNVKSVVPAPGNLEPGELSIVNGLFVVKYAPDTLNATPETSVVYLMVGVIVVPTQSGFPFPSVTENDIGA